MRGRFIVVEGVRGVGKTSLIMEAATKFRMNSVKDFHTTSFCRAVRHHYLNTDLPWRTRLALSLAAKTYLQETVIEPLLRDGVNVICERWIQSTDAYLLYPNNVIHEVDQPPSGFAILEPNLTLILSKGMEEARRNLQGEEREPHSFESLGDEYMEKVHLYYNEYCCGILVSTPEEGLSMIEQELNSPRNSPRDTL